MCRSSRYIAIVLAALPIACHSIQTPLVARAYPPLRSSFDAELQAALDHGLRELGFWDAVSHGKLSVVVVTEITDPYEPEVAVQNPDQMMYAASLPKIAILLGAFVQIERGEMELDDPTRTSLTRMIRNSSNVEATRVLRQVGIENLAEILQSDRYRLYDPETGGGLWVGKEYGSAPAWKRDPLRGLSHGATAMQTARFYYLLETDRLVSPELSVEMQEILSDPAVEHKFVRGLKDRPEARIRRKSGTWREHHADSGVIDRGRHRYIAVALVEHPHGEQWLRQLIVRIDEFMDERHPDPEEQ
jgi:beta-lactamase class A